MRKILMILSILSVLLMGCSSTYERSTEPGEVVSITLAELEEKMAKEESFVVVFAQEYCGYCMEFHEILDTYLIDHEVVLYEINLTKEEETMTQQQIVANIHENFEEFYSTPGIFYVEDGKKKDYLQVGSEGMSEELFDEWVIEHQLDQK